MTNSKSDLNRRYAPNLRGLRILVAEDEALIACDLEMTLRDLGCEVLPPAASIVQALQLLEAERPDAALLDLSLLDGLALPIAKALTIAGVPFAITTGWDIRLIESPVLVGVPFLLKPYQPHALRATLVRLVEGSRASVAA